LGDGRAPASSCASSRRGRTGVGDARPVRGFAHRPDRWWNGGLRARDYTVEKLDFDQFARCTGGVHCLTMPLAKIAYW